MVTQTRIINESQVNPALDAAIKETLVACFPRDKDAFSQARAWHGSSPAYSVIIEDDDRVIAHTGVVDRVIDVGGKQFRAAGVQNVCVLPQHRGTGLSDTVLKVAMDWARQLDFDFGLLFTDETTKKVYTRNDWLQITGQNFFRIDNGSQIPKPPESVKMYYPLKLADFPAGDVDLQGNDW